MPPRLAEAARAQFCFWDVCGACPSEPPRCNAGAARALEAPTATKGPPRAAARRSVAIPRGRRRGARCSARIVTLRHRRRRAVVNAALRARREDFYHSAVSPRSPGWSAARADEGRASPRRRHGRRRAPAAMKPTMESRLAVGLEPQSARSSGASALERLADRRRRLPIRTSSTAHVGAAARGPPRPRAPPRPQAAKRDAALPQPPNACDEVFEIVRWTSLRDADGTR